MNKMAPAGAMIRPDGRLAGDNVSRASRRLKDLHGLFRDESAYRAADPEQIVYEVETHDECGHAEGGLLFGTSILYPGRVGDEYFMTKGHYHEKLDRGEYYWGISGSGLLLMMDDRRSVSAVPVEPGSLHYVPGYTAHRLVNTGDALLVVGACWPADAGHDYGALAERGFPVRVVERGGKPTLIETP